MCIRDRHRQVGQQAVAAALLELLGHIAGPDDGPRRAVVEAVSYTHLTLPTIYSV